MPNDVLSWLNGGRDYYAGVELLRRHGARSYLITLLSSGPDHFNTPKLLAELQKLKSVESPSPKVAIAITNESAISTLSKAYNDAPDHYVPDRNLEKKLRIESLIKQLFKEITHLHGKLSQLPEGEQLHECAKTLLAKNAKKQDFFDQLHYYKNNGVWWDELPENQRLEFDPNDTEQLEQKIKNLRASRSKAKKLISKPLPQGIYDHHKRRIAAFDAEIAKYTALRKTKK